MRENGKDSDILRWLCFWENRLGSVVVKPSKQHSTISTSAMKLREKWFLVLQ